MSDQEQVDRMVITIVLLEKGKEVVSMFLYLRSKLETALKISSVLGLFFSIVYIISGKWIISAASLLGTLLFNLLICSINPSYCFWDLFKKVETYSLYSIESIAPLTKTEEQLMTKWKRQASMIGGLLFAIPGILMGLLELTVAGIIFGYLNVVLFLDWFLFLSGEQAKNFLKSHSANLDSKKQWIGDYGE